MDLNVWLWIASGLLAAVLLVSTSKIVRAPEKIAAGGRRGRVWTSRPLLRRSAWR